MSIVQISRIQNRRGLSSVLPQLSAAELGWVTDQRKLYIGNGTTAEGAPVVGNTEILTEFSGIGSSNYTYEGTEGGYTVTTGPASTAIIRTMQEKLDDVASVKDFGAVGDGVTDDSAAINRALSELFTQDVAAEESRRALFFPAGVYLVATSIKVPPYAKIYGDGANSTYIQATSGSLDTVLRTVDSLSQTGSSIGTNGATIPQYITFSDMTIERTVQSTSNVDVVTIDRATDITFNRVKISAAITTPVTDLGADTRSNISFVSDGTLNVKRVYFTNCVISNGYRGVVTSGTAMSNVVFDGCYFNKLSRGIFDDSSSEEWSHIKVVNSRFEDIYERGVYVSVAAHGWMFINNHFANVGDANVAGTATYTIFDITGNNNYFVGNYMENRQDYHTNYNLVYNTPVVERQLANEIRMDNLVQQPGRQLTMADNTSSASMLGLQFLDAHTGVEIMYKATRSSSSRTGKMTVAHDGNTALLSDDYVEQGATGLTINVDPISTESFDAASDVDPSTDQLTFTSHSIKTGQHFTYNAGGGTVITGLTDGARYYAIWIDANTIKLATTHANAIAGTPVDITVDGVGTQTLDGEGYSIYYGTTSTGITGLITYAIRYLD